MKYWIVENNLDEWLPVNSDNGQQHSVSFYPC